MSQYFDFYYSAHKYKLVINYLYRESELSHYLFPANEKKVVYCFFPSDVTNAIIKFAKQTFETIDNSAIKDLERRKSVCVYAIQQVQQSNSLFKLADDLQKKGYCFVPNNCYDLREDIIDGKKISLKSFNIYCDIHECGCGEYISKEMLDDKSNNWTKILEFDEDTIDDYDWDYDSDKGQTTILVPVLHKLYPKKLLGKKFAYFDCTNYCDAATIEFGIITDNGLIKNEKTGYTIGKLGNWDSLELFVIDMDLDKVARIIAPPKYL